MNKWLCPIELREFPLKQAQIYIQEKYRIGVSITQLRSWVRDGLVLHSGNKIFLRAEKHACWVTTQTWIDRFFKKVQEEQKQKSTQDTKEKDTEKLLDLKGTQKYIKQEYQLDVTVPQLRCWIKLGRVSNSNHRFVLGAKKRSGLCRGWFTTKKQIDAFVCELDT